jgi:hypothetical protein
MLSFYKLEQNNDIIIINAQKFFKIIERCNGTFIKKFIFIRASQQHDLLLKYATWNTLLKHNLKTLDT